MELILNIKGDCHKLTTKNDITICYTYGDDIQKSLKNIMNPIDDGSKILGLMGFYTNIDYRRKGYATLFLKKIIEHYKKTDYKLIALGVDKTNEKAISLYEKVGFKIKNERGSYYFMTLIL